MVLHLTYIDITFAHKKVPFKEVLIYIFKHIFNLIPCASLSNCYISMFIYNTQNTSIVSKQKKNILQHPPIIE